MAGLLTSRALLAVALFAGFYATGLALAAMLAWLPWAQVRYTGALDPSGILAAVGSLYVLWAVIPPRSKWVAPGLELTASTQPRLQAMVEDVARRVGHPLPARIYLTETVNAFAGSRPRWLGLRREPIMGVGLPLFAIFSEKEWAATLGHEFGHHAGGDVRLGPWQYSTHRAIAAALDRLDGSAVFLHLPFYLYGRLFLRVTGSASREQELRADAVAAGLCGPEAIGGALMALDHHDPLWAIYWHGVFRPAVEVGFLLPVLEGYRVFLEATRAERAAEIKPATHAPSADDTHPPLAERLRALRLSAGSYDEQAAEPCALLDAPAATEEHLLASLLSDPAVLDKLDRLGWAEWGERVLPEVWERALGDRLATLEAMPLSSLPSLLDDGAGWWDRLRESVNVYSLEARRRQLRIWLGQWAALSLVRAGFRVSSGPGADPVLERDALRIQPFRWVQDLAAGRRTPLDWEDVARKV